MAYAGGTNPNVVVVPTTAPGVYTNYASKSSIVLGVLQIMFSVAFIVLVVVLFVVLISDAGLTLSVMGGGNLYYVGDAFYIITGIFGIAAGVSRTKCPIITFMVFSILAAIFGICGLIGWGWVSSIFGSIKAQNLGNKYLDKIAAVVYSITALYLIETIVAIWSCIICCQVACCGAGQQQSVVVVQTQQYPQNQMAMVSPNNYQYPPNTYRYPQNQMAMGYPNSYQYPQDENAPTSSKDYSHDHGSSRHSSSGRHGHSRRD